MLWGTVSAQRVAVLVPEPGPAIDAFADRLEDELKRKVRLVDRALGTSAFDSFAVEAPFNLDVETAKSIGAAVGADYLLITRGNALRRFSFAKKSYFEGFAAVFVVNTRTGRLVDFKLASVDAADSASAIKSLESSAGGISTAIVATIAADFPTEAVVNESAPPFAPEEGSPTFGDFRPPLPYKRISPTYTSSASLYGIEATVDIEVEFDSEGRVRKTFVRRWAGFGLDESVDAAVRKMNWRPASKSGRNVPVRVLLRYNFKNIKPTE